MHNHMARFHFLDGFGTIIIQTFIHSWIHVTQRRSDAAQETHTHISISWRSSSGGGVVAVAVHKHKSRKKWLRNKHQNRTNINNDSGSGDDDAVDDDDGSSSKYEISMNWNGFLCFVNCTFTCESKHAQCIWRTLPMDWTTLSNIKCVCVAAWYIPYVYPTFSHKNSHMCVRTYEYLSCSVVYNFIGSSEYIYCRTCRIAAVSHVHLYTHHDPPPSLYKHTSHRHSSQNLFTHTDEHGENWIDITRIDLIISMLLAFFPSYIWTCSIGSTTHWHACSLARSLTRSLVRLLNVVGHGQWACLCAQRIHNKVLFLFVFVCGYLPVTFKCDAAIHFDFVCTLLYVMLIYVIPE